MSLLSGSSFREPNVAIEAIKGQQTLAELSTSYELTQQQISTWKWEVLSKPALVFTQEIPEKVRDRELRFMYLAAIIDVFSRYIVGWGISSTMDTEWCFPAGAG